MQWKPQCRCPRIRRRQCQHQRQLQRKVNIDVFAGLTFAADFSGVDPDISLDSQSTIDMQELFDVQEAAAQGVVNGLLVIRNASQLAFKGFPIPFELPEHSTIKQLKSVFYQALLLSRKPNQTKFLFVYQH